MFGWAMFDFANSGYTTVVLTTLFNVYFVTIICSPAQATNPTLLWTLATGSANLLILLSAPLLGAIADHYAMKKKLLLLATAGCALCTALLVFCGPGTVLLAFVLIVMSNYLFACSENLIAAFLPEISSTETAGRISGIGWSLGYVGGILALLLSLAYIDLALERGLSQADAVPHTMLLTAILFCVSATPTFLLLKERAVASPLAGHHSLPTELIRAGAKRLRDTFAERHRHRDLFRFLLAMCLFQAGVATVIVVAAIYANQVIGMSQRESIIMVLVINVAAAAGAFCFGNLQPLLGSVRTLSITLIIWMLALATVYQADAMRDVWIGALLIGIAMGSSQSAGRALVSQLTPPGMSAEFFGLWGFAGRLAAIIGPLSYGLINQLSNGDHQQSLLSTGLFILAGFIILQGVNEKPSPVS